MPTKHEIACGVLGCYPTIPALLVVYTCHLAGPGIPCSLDSYAGEHTQYAQMELMVKTVGQILGLL